MSAPTSGDETQPEGPSDDLEMLGMSDPNLAIFLLRPFELISVATTTRNWNTDDRYKRTGSKEKGARTGEEDLTSRS